MKPSMLILAFISLSQGSPILDIDLKKIVRLGKTCEAAKNQLPFYFTSTYAVRATPGQVVDSENKPTGGLKGASGLFLYGINVYENVICYNITIDGFRGTFQSPAKTATHIHEANRGQAGPPRIAFPNPTGEKGHLNSVGCVKGPFKTGVLNEGIDTGDGFHVEEIEKDPSQFFTDVHSSEAVPGAVRGQLGSEDK